MKRRGVLLLSEALPLQFDAMGVMGEAIEHRHRDGRVADDPVPGVDGQLAGDDRRSRFVAVLDDFQEIAALLGIELDRAPNRRE